MAAKLWYSKDLIYPADGTELQLEQLRSQLPKYMYKPPLLEHESFCNIKKFWYCKDLIYPPAGGELQLEQVRAQLSQYKPSFPEGLCDMEMTEACVSHITTMIPVQSSNLDNMEIDELGTSLAGLDLEEQFEQRVHQLVLEKDASTSLQDKENQKSTGVYGFTPESAGDGRKEPFRGINEIHVNTKLNFTDADSILSTQSRFNTTLDLENKVKLVTDEDEFVVTEFEGITHARPQIGNRRVLQPIHPKSSISELGNGSTSQASFSVYDNTCDESSFVPYCDSMQADNTSCRTGPSLLSSYSAPLGAPLHANQPLPEQSFTQIDIAHPKDYKPASTPKDVHQWRAIDLSVITSDEDKIPIRTQHLSTITEESSGHSKLTSSSSSRFTASSNSSNSNSCPYPVSDELPELNPFLPDMVNRMLNAVGGVPQHIVHYTANTLPSIGVSSKLNLSGESFFLTSLLAEGSFSRTYSTATSAVLQIHSAPLDWPITITNLLQSRLQTNNFHHLLEGCFQKYEKVHQLQSTFVTVSTYHPFGSVQDIINKCSTAKRHLPDSVVLYLCVNMIALVETLHQCGIIHAAITPAHFLICDTSKRLSSDGQGLQLIGFRHSVDLKQFPEDQMFSGTPSQLAYSFVLGKYWKWEVDYIGLAECILSLIASTPAIVKCKERGLYTWSSKPYRKYNIPLWQEIIEKLLNSNFVSLSQLKQHLKQNTDWNEAGLRRLVCLGNS